MDALLVCRPRHATRRGSPGRGRARCQDFHAGYAGLGHRRQLGPMAGNLAEAQASGQGGGRGFGGDAELPASAAVMCNAYQGTTRSRCRARGGRRSRRQRWSLPVAIAGAERMKGVAAGSHYSGDSWRRRRRRSRRRRDPLGSDFFGRRPRALPAAPRRRQTHGSRWPAMIDALSIAYGQVCGTIQAHTEGSMLLAIQVVSMPAMPSWPGPAARGFDAPNVSKAHSAISKDLIG